MVWMLTMTIVHNLHFCELSFSWKLTGLHVRRDACILLWGEFTSLSVTLLVFSWKLTALNVRRGACILLWGEAAFLYLNPSYISWFLRTNLLLKADSITCEKGCLHSALGGGAAPSPQSLPPAFYLNPSYISWGWQVAIFANQPSLESWQRYMWEEVLSFCFGGRRCALPPIPASRFFILTQAR